MRNLIKLSYDYDLIYLVPSNTSIPVHTWFCLVELSKDSNLKSPGLFDKYKMAGADDNMAELIALLSGCIKSLMSSYS
jgi:hypothetical protein